MSNFSTIPTEVFDAIGVVGFGLYVLNYTLLTWHKVTSDQIMYFAVNLAAATLVLIGLTGAFNLAAALIQVFWIVISIIAIRIRLRQVRPVARHPRAPLPPEILTKVTAIESRIAPPFVSQRRPDPRWQDGSPKSCSLDLVSGKRNPPRAVG